MVPCNNCYGFGLWAVGDSLPMGRIDAYDGCPTIPCAVCGKNANPINPIKKRHKEQIASVRTKEDLEMFSVEGLLELSKLNDEIQEAKSLPRVTELHQQFWALAAKILKTKEDKALNVSTLSRTLKPQIIENPIEGCQSITIPKCACCTRPMILKRTEIVNTSMSTPFDETLMVPNEVCITYRQVWVCVKNLSSRSISPSKRCTCALSLSRNQRVKYIGAVPTALAL